MKLSSITPKVAVLGCIAVLVLIVPVLALSILAIAGIVWLVSTIAPGVVTWLQEQEWVQYLIAQGRRLLETLDWQILLQLFAG